MIRICDCICKGGKCPCIWSCSRNRKLLVLKVTLLSAPMSSELPFCKTTLLRKQLISQIQFGRSKIGEKDVVLHGLSNQKICKSQCFS